MEPGKAEKLLFMIYNCLQKFQCPHEYDDYDYSLKNGECREIMHAMWKPQKFKYIYLLATLYVFTLTIPSASAVYWAFGDELLNHANAFSLLPKNRFRDAAVILMLIHQVTLFFIVYFMVWYVFFFVTQENYGMIFCYKM